MVQNYFCLDVLEIKQFQNNCIVSGKINYNQLKSIARLTARKPDEIDKFNTSQENVKYQEEEFLYQRSLDKKRINEISSFLRDEINKKIKGDIPLGLFPTSIIIALNKNQDADEYLEEQDSKLIDTKIQDFLSKDTDGVIYDTKNFKLYIPETKAIALIVDGQHRFEGLNNLYKSYKKEESNNEVKRIVEEIESFEFIATFLLDFDLYLQGIVFAKVNFEQKPVNKSLYYDIFGALPDTERNELKIAHELVVHLNIHNQSPLKEMIRMLGKGWGLLSQAFFVEAILPHFEKGVWEYLYGDYLRGGDNYKKLGLFMRTYFSAIKSSFGFAWPKKVEREIDGKVQEVYSLWSYKNILCKTTGMAAMIMLINEIYPLVRDLEQEKMEKEIKKIYSSIPTETAKNIFSRDGEFGGTGGRGLQKKLYMRLRKLINL